MISKDNVDIVCGGLLSDIALAAMEVAAKYGKPYILTGATSEGVTAKIRKDPEKYWMIFKQNPTSLEYGRSWVTFNKYLVENKMFTPKNKTFASIADNIDWGRTNAGAFKSEMETWGWKAVAHEFVDPRQADFYSQLSKIKALKPDVLYVAQAGAAGGAAFLKQFVEIGIPALYEVAYAACLPEYITLGGKDTVGVMDLTVTDTVPGLSKDYVEKFEKRWGRKSSTVGVQQWQVLEQIKIAIEKAGSTDPRKFIDAYSKTDYTGPVGRTVFTKDHEARPGPDFIPQLITQIREEEKGQYKHYVIYPEKYAQRKFMKQPWME